MYSVAVELHLHIRPDMVIVYTTAKVKVSANNRLQNLLVKFLSPILKVYSLRFQYYTVNILYRSATQETT